jgi:hypothetical protein
MSTRRDLINLETGAGPLESDLVPVRNYYIEPAADITPATVLGICRHCGSMISAQQFAEFEACTRCSSGPGWGDGE